MVSDILKLLDCQGFVNRGVCYGQGVTGIITTALRLPMELSPPAVMNIAGAI
jgi:hypothetical protein